MKIAVTTFQRAINHGAALQMYALCKTLEKTGNEIKIIDYVPQYPNYSGGIKQKIANILNHKTDKIKAQKYAQFKKDFLGDNMTEPYTYEQLSEIEKDFDLFITGSDQLWNYRCGHFDKYYFLDFVTDKRKRASYAVSFNLESIPDSAKQEYIRRLSGMNSISVREDAGIKAVKELIGVDCEKHCDPTLLLTKGDWESVISPVNIKEKYIAIYTLGKPIRLVDEARRLAEKTGCKILYLSDFYGNLDLKHLRGLGPMEFVSYLANAEYIFTNSFHGTAFSVNLHKNFFAELNTLSNFYNYRAEALLKSCGLMNRTIEQCDNILEEAKKATDFSAVENVLDNERKRSADYFTKLFNGCEANE